MRQSKVENQVGTSFRRLEGSECVGKKNEERSESEARRGQVEVDPSEAVKRNFSSHKVDLHHPFGLLKGRIYLLYGRLPLVHTLGSFACLATRK